MALLSSTAPETPSAQAPTPTAHSAMNATVLQRQNQSLQTNLEQKRRDLDELKQKLERTEKLLLNKENALSVLDRHWEQMETQAAALLARVQAGAPPRPAHDTIQ